MTLTLRFTNNALVDVPGPDLYVFEIGPGDSFTYVRLTDLKSGCARRVEILVIPKQ